MSHLALDYKYKIWARKVRLIKEMAILDAELGATNGKIVLDGGCADGYYFPEYLARELKVIGCDINVKDNLSTARKQFNPDDNVHLCRGNVNNIPLANESVDIVFLCQLLEHLNAPEQALKEAHRILKKGGYIFVDIPWLNMVYRPLSAILLRSLYLFKHQGKIPLLFKMIFRNLDDIHNLKASTMIERRRLTSLLIHFGHLFPTFRNLEPEDFIYNYYYGTIEQDIHQQFRFPGEWAEAISHAGFKVIKKTGAFITPPPFDRLQLGNMLFSKLEHRLGDNLRLWFSQMLIIVAIKN